MKSLKNQKKPKKRKIFTPLFIWAAVSLICMTVIFLFSSRNSEQSSEMSSTLASKLFAPALDLIEVSNPTPLMGTIEVIVRKSAHFIIFFILGFCITNTVMRIKKIKKNLYIFLISVILCSVYAATDELHQYFVPGRACMWQDWVIDTAGVLLGVGLAFLIANFIFKIRRNNKLK